MEIVDVLVIISLAIFYILFFGRTVLLYKKGIKVWVIGTSAKKISEIILEKILLPLALLISFIFTIITALHIELPAIISNYLISIIWIKYIGIMFCYIGLIIFLLALISFGKSWRIGIDENNSNELITNGMFKHSRNPIFLFMDLYFTGIMLIYPNIVFILLAIGTIVGIHSQILREEKFLLNKFGERYIKYKNVTRRYV
ncbi:MAG: isoprenylcysteine carboxylmethyltransferase family protein [Fibromonadaceae bacterium]|jgi:protein-S-isoprenylcysteine O-methyltransferase Ste14|nr:isoprenylcysteine carboxylmethyltransferase family protein [Fibromonadaceae bacterium]